MLKSNMTFQHFQLIEGPSGVQFDSPVTVDGTRSAKFDIVIRDVLVDGRRGAQTGMDSQPQEDGGRSCFRIVGQVANLVLSRVRGENCATDGLELSGGSLSGHDADDSLRVRNVVVRDSEFAHNRRHGVSGQSLYDVTFMNVACQFNGLDGGVTGSEGDRGARYKGNLYGTGLDFEGYGIGSALSGISLIDINATENASAGLTFQDSASPTEINFQPRRNMNVIRGEYDAGRFFYAPEPFAIKITAQRENVDKTPALYEHVLVAGTKVRGAILMTSVTDARLTSLAFTKVGNYPFWGIVGHVTGLELVDIECDGLRLYRDHQ
jgi:hypothetical protein